MSMMMTMILTVIPDTYQIYPLTPRSSGQTPSFVQMQRHARHLDGSIHLAAILYDEEQAVVSQDAVGLYDG